MALLAVSLGVALAWSVHLINRSALGEFAAAVRSANGDPDLTLAGQREGFDDALFAAVLADEAGGTGERGGRGGNARPHRERCLRERRQQRRSERRQQRRSERQQQRRSERRQRRRRERRQRRLCSRQRRTHRRARARRRCPAHRGAGAGAAAVAARGETEQVFLDPGVVFINGAARERLRAASLAGAVRGTAAPAAPSASPTQLQLQAGSQWAALRVAGDVAIGGAPLIVMDIAAAQRAVRLRRSRLAHLAHLAHLADLADLAHVPDLPHLAHLAHRPAAGTGARRGVAARAAGASAAAADGARRRACASRGARLDLSRAYRVNLTVLAGIALFVGGFLVFSVVALSVAQRTPALALLGVLGLTARGRGMLVLGECAAVGLAGGLIGVAAGTAMAALALVALAGDLGGGYFPRWPRRAPGTALEHAGSRRAGNAGRGFRGGGWPLPGARGGPAATGRGAQRPG
ncbi:MAG: FtsX-like permease family protein [Rubrivivax sp.]